MKEEKIPEKKEVREQKLRKKQSYPASIGLVRKARNRHLPARTVIAPLGRLLNAAGVRVGDSGNFLAKRVVFGRIYHPVGLGFLNTLRQAISKKILEFRMVDPKVEGSSPFDIKQGQSRKIRFIITCSGAVPLR